MAEEAKRLGKRVFEARLEPPKAAAIALDGRKVLAFAGIGRPEKFFGSLRACGAVVEITHSFPDHHRYTAAELATLRQEAEARGLQAVTTEKDLVRIAAIADREPWPDLTVLPIQLRIENEAGLRNLLLRRINERRLRTD
jgi:tetraacyldisaccharide 4'-kinase